MCWMHYKRWLRYGGPGPTRPIGKRATLRQRFDDHVHPASMPEHAPHLGYCYVWTGYVHASGFGAIWSGHRLLYVHRVSWEWTYGPIPAGAKVYQVCRNRLCVRPDHLTLG